MNKQDFIDYPATSFRKIRKIVIDYVVKNNLIKHHQDFEFIKDFVEEHYYKAIWKNYYDNSLLIIEYSFRLNSSHIHIYKHEKTDFINKGIE